jgi:predicted HicB family RNase H-like nuclease
MPNKAYDKQVNVRLAEPVFIKLRDRAEAEDLKVSDLVRRAIRVFIGTQENPTESTK